ncbi:hypothetical protein LLG46_06205 [bacterium]|nr:hypothetical protein [bacterium]
MIRLLRGIRSILAGIAVAGVLYAVLWRQAGTFYNSLYKDPLNQLIYLFIFHFTPGLIAIAVSAGLLTGAVPGESRLKSAPVRGALVAVIFGMISVVTYMCFGSGSAHSSSPEPIVIKILLYTLAIMVSAIIGAIGSFYYAVATAAFAEIGAYLWRLSKWLCVLTITLACCVSLSLSFVEGTTARSNLHALERRASRAEPLIKQNLVALPSHCIWRPSGRLQSQKFSAICDIPDGIVSVQYSAGGKLKSARVVFRTPKALKLTTKDSVVNFLQDHGVSRKLAVRIKQKNNGMWLAEEGPYSVFFDLWSPPRD